MILYLVKSGLCLAILLAFYHLVLEREKMHQFNRFYLLGSVLFSFLAPSYIIYIETKATIKTSINYLEDSIYIQPKMFEEYINLENGLYLLYFIVSLVFLIRFITNLYHIIKKIRVNEIIKDEHAKFVTVADKILPHTFWNYIFINKEDYSNQKIEKELFTHELAHVTQKHTIDVLILEMLQILFWFNPLFFLLKKAVQLNHEFLADDKVISSHNNISRYQYLLLNKAAWKNEYYLASNLNYSLTKKRLLMMTTTNSRTNILLKKLAILPLLTGLLFVFANRIEAQTTKKKPQVIEVKQVEKGITKAEMKEYQDFMKGVDKNSILKLKDVIRIGVLYKKMSKAQKKTVTNIYEFLPPPPPPRKLKEVKEIKKPKAPKVSKKAIDIIEIKEVEIPLKKKKDWEKVEKLIGDPNFEEKEIEEETEVEEVVEVVDLIGNVTLLKNERREIIEEEIENNELLEVELKEYDTITYYINGKKVSEKKAKKLMGSPKKIKNINIVKGKKGKGNIYIFSK